MSTARTAKDLKKVSRDVKKAVRDTPKRNTEHATTRRGKSAAPRSRVDSRATERNDYLDSLLNPRAAKGRKIGVPSGNLPSTRFQTKRVFTVTVDPNGNASYALMPAIVDGGIKLGTNAAGEVTTMISSTGNDLVTAGFTAAGYAACTVLQMINTPELQDVVGSATGIRPVSMQVDWIPTGAALVEAGQVDVRLCSRDDRAGATDTVTSGSSGQLISGVGPSGISAIISDDRSYPTRSTESISAFWAPEDEQDFVYRPVLGASALGTTGNAEGAAIAGFKRLAWVSSGAGTPTDTAMLPEEIIQQQGQTGTTYNSNIANGYPYLQFTFRGLQNTAAVTTNVGTLTAYINWEMIVDGTRVIDSAQVCVENPLELAQASNVLSLIPPLTVPTAPANPLTLVHEAATTAVDHLYKPNVSKKQAIEGTSWVSSLVKSAAPMLGGLASMIPGIGAVAGPIATAGASLIASLLG
jgi:hypothetical protein